jgi:transketolase
MNSRELAQWMRKQIVSMHQRGTNIGSAMSIADIMAVLYRDILRIAAPDDPARDRFILSKGHGVSALYAALCHKGLLPADALATYLHDGSALTGHPAAGSVPGIEVSTGSLGHGLAIGVGMALAAMRDGRCHRVFVLMGDGEIQEGSVWEAAIHGAALQLDNLVAIVDINRLQGYGRVEALMPVASMAGRWRAFGWRVVEVDGHDHAQLRHALDRTPGAEQMPTVVLAHTVKGKGVAEMEDQLGWHYFSVPSDKVAAFQAQLEDDGCGEGL